ncbi:pimeloyl-ACP methyl ester carboxylesterase [Nocardia sp. GAS34]|uniref:alpha/beta fold hydrolase n=1 Tax=unclassified Nocardia TaxID=2637762 RepID=UPI003D1EC4B6
MNGWNYTERGSGRPLVLLHGGGSSARAWLPTMDRLAAQRRVIALDFPGFGETSAVRGSVFAMDWAMHELATELTRHGIEEPVDIAGNSMGGWFGLEAAQRGMARSVVAISPAGLWARGMPSRIQIQFARAACGAWIGNTPPLRYLLHVPASRKRALSVSLAHADRMPAGDAIRKLQDLTRAVPTLLRMLGVVRRTRFEGGQHLTIPITVAFGTLDRMVLPGDSQFRDQLPTHTRWLELPDVGHTPMGDAPDLIADTILTGTEIGM